MDVPRLVYLCVTFTSPSDRAFRVRFSRAIKRCADNNVVRDPQYKASEAFFGYNTPLCVSLPPTCPADMIVKISLLVNGVHVPWRDLGGPMQETPVELPEDGAQTHVLFDHNTLLTFTGRRLYCVSSKLRDGEPSFWTVVKRAHSPARKRLRIEDVEDENERPMKELRV
jgi:hypothetical protein